MASVIEDIYRRDGRRIYSTLVRLLGSMDAAEEALHDAFVAATEQWPARGVPANPVAWLVSTGRFKAIDRIRRQTRFVSWDAAPETAEAAAAVADDQAANWEHLWDAREDIEDDRLRLIFTCCHPSLSEASRIALTLREVCGLPTEAIAAACLIATSTLAQRIVRAKGKIKAAGIPYEVPGPAERPARLASVLRVIYLVFNEGYSAHAGAAVQQCELVDEAIRLARLLTSLMPGEPEVTGLLALMQLHHARRASRCNAEGDLVPLEEQDRSRWDRAAITEGAALAEAALRQRGFGAYSLQAAIAAVHAEAADVAATDWPQIIGLYDALMRSEPSPVVALNRAVAVAMRDGPDAGLALIGPLLPVLPDYHLAPAAMADLCRRAGRIEAAREYYQAAAALAQQAPERRFLMRRLAELGE
ncbi:MAG: RNA polymerase sigma factor [Burkholderiaceae bacterium]